MSNEVIRIPHHISQTFIRSHPEWNFVYGYDMLQRGMGGQSWSCVGEPNCFRVFTIYKKCSSSVYFTDGNQFYREQMLKSIYLIPRDKPVIIFRKIGEGCSRMNEMAPLLFKEMKDLLGKLQYPNIEIFNTTV